MTTQLPKLVIIATLLIVNAVTVKPKHLADHSAVTEDTVYPYVVAVLKMHSFVSNGALINENWIVTSADGIIDVKDLLRHLRIRLGSINYKKGGEMRAVKLIEIHPSYERSKPTFDITLVLMSAPVTYNLKVRAIRIQMSPKEVSATHYIVTSWRGAINYKANKTRLPTNVIKRHVLLSVSQLHPMEPEDCAEELQELGFRNHSVMCLDPDELDVCMNHNGAPVVLNGVLWGVVSSYTTPNCNEQNAASMFVTLLYTQNVSVWLHQTVHKHRWYNNI